MVRKIVAMLVLAAASFVGFTATAPAHAAAAVCGEPGYPPPGYSPCIPTATTITVTVAGPGEEATIEVSARENAGPVEGDIAVRLFAGNATERTSTARTTAKPLLATTVHVVNDPVRIQGPALPKGTYTGTAEFTPTNATRYLPSSDRTRVRVGVGGGPGSDADNGGALPDTGGPNMMWLLLGTGLVVAGAGSVTLARRRTPAVA